MTITPMEFESLALIAGGMITGANVPQILLNLTDPVAAAKQSLLRNLLLLIGNSLWVYYGLQNGLMAVPLFCGINACLISVLVAQQLWRKSFTPSDPLSE
jgi:hypothetical protein